MTKQKPQITKEKIAELRGLVAEATPGPWRVEKYDSQREEGLLSLDCNYPDDPTGNWKWSGWVDIRTETNLRLVTAAVNTLPALLDRVEELEETLGVARKQFLFYAEGHRKKSHSAELTGAETKAYLIKAETNERYAKMCGEALSKTGGV